MSETLWQKVVGIFKKKPEPVAPAPEEDEAQQCCNGKVHIAYRGMADDHLYMAYSRKWSEVRFFKPHGLRVFCADCRRRLL
ncbi:MAG TPA: hypothetical protein V6C81_30435 [Planktothrix sp.]|jgi:hypothetical protein